MGDIPRYRSLMGRQKKKLAYARKLVPKLEQATVDIGPNPSLNSVARWLQNKRVRPSADSKPGSKWVPQTVQDYVYCDGVEPTEEVLRAPPDRSDGFRVSAMRAFFGVEATIASVEGTERLNFERQYLDRHIEEISEVARLLRSALRIPH